MFSYLPLCVDEGQTDSLEQIIDNNTIDFGLDVKNRLKRLVVEIQGRKILPVQDDYTVEVNLKDFSVYSPRRFAKIERLQIRAITDDLLRRGVIKPSVSPYCARIVPVKKKSGKMRLCVDLRPLNSRVIKQKYPFPIIEECLSRLHNKRVFTLLDLKDSFHQIRVHDNSTKYFAFATAFRLLRSASRVPKTADSDIESVNQAG